MEQLAGRGVRAPPHDARHRLQRTAAEAFLFHTPSTLKTRTAELCNLHLKSVTESINPMGFHFDHDPPRYHSISLGDRGNNGFKNAQRWR
eukprot:1271299-Pleurochrysis_carterae.AAC.1